MAKEKTMANAALRTLLLAVEEVIGENGVKSVLNLAKMGHFIDNYPPNDVEMGVKFSEYGAVQQAVEDSFGPRGARAILMRIGRKTFQYGLEEQPAILGLAGLALKLLPTDTRVKLILNKVADAAIKSTNQPSHVEEEDKAFIYVAEDCPCRFRKRELTTPCCFVTVGVLQQALKWATDKSYDVREISCINIGGDACRYRINKEPIG
ncbi:MAG: 4-vinyl reductase [Anaerolineae bacterium]